MLAIVPYLVQHPGSALHDVATNPTRSGTLDALRLLPEGPSAGMMTANPVKWMALELGTGAGH